MNHKKTIFFFSMCLTLGNVASVSASPLLLGAAVAWIFGSQAPSYIRNQRMHSVAMVQAHQQIGPEYNGDTKITFEKGGFFRRSQWHIKIGKGADFYRGVQTTPNTNIITNDFGISLGHFNKYKADLKKEQLGLVGLNNI
jgi:hypothetical protein